MKKYWISVLSVLIYLPIFYINFIIIQNPSVISFVLLFLSSILFGGMIYIFSEDFIHDIFDRIKINGIVSAGFIIWSTIVSVFNIDNFFTIISSLVLLTILFFSLEWG